MGRLTPLWHEELIAALLFRGIAISNEQKEDFSLLVLIEHQVIINLIDLPPKAATTPLIRLQEQHRDQGIYLVHLWEDIWKTKQIQVLGRIMSILGMNRKLYGRQTEVVVINQKQADEFLDKNHLQGSVRSKYKFALSIAGELVAVALFSGARPMKRIAPDYHSYELIRFATLVGFTLTGGFSKLLKHFIAFAKPNDIMSYADRDWSLGYAYERAGFKLVAETPPLDICLDRTNYSRHFPHRLPAHAFEQPGADYLSIFNTGNLKYILYL